jgi:predicted RNA binding protein YcfA (HicA-like mRNA interferase family)
MNKQFTITKRIAKHGKQAVIVVPKVIEHELKPGTIAKITIDVIEKSSY